MFPAQLKLKLDTGEKTFVTLESAATLLKELGVEVGCRERERMEEELKDGWRSNAKRKRDTVLSTSDQIRLFCKRKVKPTTNIKVV